MKRTLVALAATVAALPPIVPANAMAYVQADPPQISLVTKTSARLSCVFHVAPGYTAYPQIFSYHRTSSGAVTEKSYYVGGGVGGGPHRLTQDRGGLHSGTTYIVRCEASYAPGGPLGTQTAKAFTTLPSSGT